MSQKNSTLEHSQPSKELMLHESRVKLDEERRVEENRLRALGRRGLTEFAYRVSDGIHVSLLWHEESNHLRVEVEDHKAGESFSLLASAENAVDMFYHPYAYTQDLGALATSQAA